MYNVCISLSYWKFNYFDDQVDIQGIKAFVNAVLERWK